MYEEFMNFDYPVEESYQNNLASSFAPSFQTPAFDAYQSYVGSTPRREDYQGNFLQKLLAGIAGFSTGMKDPVAGVKTSMSIMDAPYLRAMQQYQSMEPGLRNAATIEERGMDDKINYMKALQESQRYSQEMGLKKDQFSLDRDQFGLEQQKFKLDQAKLSLDQAYKNGQLTNEQYQNETARINAMANQAQSSASANQSNAMAGYYSARTENPSAFISGGNDDPNASLIKLQIQQKLLSDPRFQNLVTDKNTVDLSDMDPTQLAAYQQILREAGVYNSFGAR